jgi:hypothetical protein
MASDHRVEYRADYRRREKRGEVLIINKQTNIMRLIKILLQLVCLIN